MSLKKFDFAQNDEQMSCEDLPGEGNFFRALSISSGVGGQIYTVLQRSG